MNWEKISWRCIIAGVVTSLAVSLIMTLLGVALGFTVVQPTAHDPLSGLGTAFGIWSIVSVVVALAAGGFASGLFSGVRGAEHGFMVWATVLLAGTVFSGIAIGSAVKTVGAALQTVGSGVASVASTVGDTVGDGISQLASAAVDQVKDSVNLNVDYNELGDDVRSVLHDTGVEKLQPAYLQSQMRDVRSDLSGVLHRLTLDPGDHERIISAFLDKEKARFENVTSDIDKNAAVTALMKQRNLSRAEAEKTVDNAITAYNRAVDKSRQALAEVRVEITQARDHLRDLAAAARVRAAEMASTAAKSALAAAIALIVGAVICCYAGWFGTRYSGRPTLLIEERQRIDLPLDRPGTRTQTRL